MRRRWPGESAQASDVLYAVPIEQVVARFDLPVTVSPSAERHSAPSTSALSAVLASVVPEAVVTITSPRGAPTGCMAFFVAPDGYLLAPRRALRRLAGESLATLAEQELRLGTDGDPAGLEQADRARPHLTCVHHSDTSDWVLLKTDLAPDGYLPLVGARGGAPSVHDQVRVYPFDPESQSAIPRVQAIDGVVSSSGASDRTFQIRLAVGGIRQEGAAVIDITSGAVVGMIVAYPDCDRGVAKACSLDIAELGSFVPDLDLRGLAHSWRAMAADLLRASHPALSRLAVRAAPPPLPKLHLDGRPALRDVIALVSDNAAGGAYLHGPSGSGKTILAAEAADTLFRRRAAQSVFWHDFEPPGNQSIHDLVRRLALHMVEHHGTFAPIDACLASSFDSDTSAAASAVSDAVALGAHVFVFDNVHAVQREGRPELPTFLGAMVRAAEASDAIVLLTSWYPPRTPLACEVVEVAGFARAEVAEYLELHQVEASRTTVNWIAQLAEDIGCVESFVRDPGWREAIEAGRVAARILAWRQKTRADLDAFKNSGNRRCGLDGSPSSEQFAGAGELHIGSQPAGRTAGRPIIVATGAPRACATARLAASPSPRLTES